MKFLIICGEASSTTYGHALAIELQKQNHKLFSIGGSQLKSVSHQLLEIDPTFHRVDIGRSRFKQALLASIQRVINEYAQIIDRAIIVDFPGYNFKIAKMLQTNRIPIITFITPNFWLLNQQKLGMKLLGYSQKVIAIFEKEYEFYIQLAKKLNCSDKIKYLGHPLCLSIMLNTAHQQPSSDTIGVFPGSRRSEISHHLPIMAGITKRIKGAKSIVIFCDNHSLHGHILTILRRLKWSVPIKSTIESPLAYAISAAGTNTLKLALLGVPATIIGRLNQWVYFLLRYILRLKVDFVGTPNIILSQRVCPEYIHPTPKEYQSIANEIDETLADPSKIMTIKNQYKNIRCQIEPARDYYKKICAWIIA
jgi:lipid-A-disaccharide synthase